MFVIEVTMRPDDERKSKECIFCKITQGTLPSQKVFENERVFAFKDISPQAPVHILIVPKRHVADVLDVRLEDAHVFQDLFLAAQHIAGQMGIAGAGFRTVFNSGDHACQTIFHLHLHLLGGTQMGGSMVG